MKPRAMPPRWRSASLVVLALSAGVGCASSTQTARRGNASPSTGAREDDAFKRGMTQLGARQADQALKSFQAGASADPADPYLRAMIGYCEMLLHDDANAARDAQRALDLGAQGVPRAWALLTQGELAHRSMDTARAVSILTEATTVAPSLATIWAALGDAQFHAPGAASAAARAYQQSLQIDPEYSRAIAGLSRLLASAGRVDDAFALLEPALARAPGDPDLLRCRGVILFDIGKFAEAEKDFRDGLKSSPKDAALFVELGNALDMQKKYAEAEAAYRKALVLDKSGAEAHFNLAVSLAGQGKLEAALDEVNAELATNPRHLNARKLQEQIRRKLHR